MGMPSVLATAPGAKPPMPEIDREAHRRERRQGRRYLAIDTVERASAHPRVKGAGLAVGLNAELSSAFLCDPNRISL